MLTSRALKDRRAFLRFLASSPIMVSAGFTAGWMERLMAEEPVKDAASLGAQNEILIKSVKEALNVFDFDAVARTRLSLAHYTFITDGSFNNETVRANREGFSKYEIRLRRLTGIGKVDQSIRLFGTTWESPIFFCPVGRMNAYYPQGAVVVARAAKSTSTLQILAGSAAMTKRAPSGWLPTSGQLSLPALKSSPKLTHCCCTNSNCRASAVQCASITMPCSPCASSRAP